MFLQQPKARCLGKHPPLFCCCCYVVMLCYVILSCRSDFSFFFLSGLRVLACVYAHVYTSFWFLFACSRVCIRMRVCVCVCVCILLACVNTPSFYSSRRCCLCRTSFSTAAVFKKHRFFLVFSCHPERTFCCHS